MYTYYIYIYKYIDTIVWDISKQTPQESIFYLLTFKNPFQEKNNVEQDKKRNKKRKYKSRLLRCSPSKQSEVAEGGRERERERHVCLSV